MIEKEEKHRDLLVNDAGLLTLKDVFEIYESGKGRRYGLLFSVNGGAFAIFSFLVTSREAKAENLGILCIGLAMIGFSAVMGYDIHAFGHHMRKLSGPLELFGPAGQWVLKLLVALLIGAWAGAIGVWFAV